MRDRKEKGILSFGVNHYIFTFGLLDSYVYYYINCYNKNKLSLYFIIIIMTTFI